MCVGIFYAFWCIHGDSIQFHYINFKLKNNRTICIRSVSVNRFAFFCYLPFNYQFTLLLYQLEYIYMWGDLSHNNWFNVIGTLIYKRHLLNVWIKENISLGGWIFFFHGQYFCQTDADNELGIFQYYRYEKKKLLRQTLEW